LLPSTPDIAHSTCGQTAVGDEWTKTTPRVLTADLRCSTRIVFPYVLAHRVGEQIALVYQWPRWGRFGRADPAVVGCR